MSISGEVITAQMAISGEMILMQMAISDKVKTSADGNIWQGVNGTEGHMGGDDDSTDGNILVER